MSRMLQILTALAVTTAMFTAACRDVTPAIPDPLPPGTITSLLSLVPDRPEFREEVQFGDFRLLRETLDVTPGTESDVGYLIALRRDGLHAGLAWTEASWFLGIADWEALATVSGHTRTTLGFGVEDVERWLVAGLPPLQLHAIGGEFDPAEAERMLAECGSCRPAERHNHAGGTYLAWGGELEIDLAAAHALPAYDELGRGGRMVLDAEFIARSASDEPIRGLLEVRAGAPSLAENEDFRLAAAILEEYGVVLAHLTTRTTGRSAADQTLRLFEGRREQAAAQEAWGVTGDIPLFAPHTLVALGSGLAVDGPFTVAVLVHEDEVLAESSTAIFRERLERLPVIFERGVWADRFTSIEVAREGRVVVARLDGRGLAGLAVLAVSPLFLHE